MRPHHVRDILFTPTMVGGRRSKAVFGRMDPDAALNALLRGSGLTWWDGEGEEPSGPDGEFVVTPA